MLKQLAIENEVCQVRLMLGIFKMTKLNTPKAAHTLNRYGLACLPEAHNYLRIEAEIIDCTHAGSSKDDFLADLLQETEISPQQITDFKVNYHQSFLRKWLIGHPDIPYTLQEMWAIREQCIADLAGE